MDCENRGSEQLVEISNNPNDVCACIMTLLSVNISEDKQDQLTSVILDKLVHNDTERLPGVT